MVVVVVADRYLVAGVGRCCAISFMVVSVGGSCELFAAFCATIMHVTVLCPDVPNQIACVCECLLTFITGIAKTRSKT